MSWTWHAENADSEDASDTSVTLSLTVSAGDLVVVMMKWEGADTTITGDIGGEALTEWANAGNPHIRLTNEPWCTCLYKINTALTGSQTITLTLGAARGFKEYCAMSYTPTAGTVSTNGTPNSGLGTSTSPASGNITTTGSDMVIFGFNAGYGSQLSSPLINGNAAEEAVEPATASRDSQLWARRESAGFTGQAAATLAGSARWACGVIAFNIAAAGTNPKGPLGNPFQGPFGGQL